MKSLNELVKENKKDTVKGYFEFEGEKSMKRVITLEIANSSSKAITLSDKLKEIKTIYEPNTIRLVEHSDIDLHLTNDNKVYYTYNKKIYDLGGANATGTGGKDRDYGSEEFTAQVIITISKLLEYETEEIYLVYGLPATSIDNKLIIDQLNKLKGKHEVYEGKKRRSFEIMQVKCIAQPVGTLFKMTFDINGNLIGQLDPRKKYMIFDEGFQTLDIVEVSLSSGITKKETYPFGMSDYNRQLRDLIDKRYPNKHIRSLYQDLYKFDRDIREGSLIVRGDDIKVKEIQKEIDYVQEDFVNKMYQQLSIDGWDFQSFNNIILTGGGCLVLVNAIKKRFGKDYANDIILVDDPIMSNVIGYYIFGRKHFKI